MLPETAALLRETAAAMVAPGKGILAMDESNGTCNTRFEALGIAGTESNRRAYRDLLITTPGLNEYVAGAILYDETVRQATTDGTPFPDHLTANGILPGIKVDTGAKPLAGHPGETVTEGLDGLRDRLTEYRKIGARFAKWRAVLRIGASTPTVAAVAANAHALARYAALCQEAGVVPIVEPEVLMEGDHDADTCLDVTCRVLEEVFAQLTEQGVDPAGIVLKPSMVLPGSESGIFTPPDVVAANTIRCLIEAVPATVPGIAFLSGGQSDDDAVANLNAMNLVDHTPWALTFSYGRALQRAARDTWAGDDANRAAAQAALLERTRLNSLASQGLALEEAAGV